MLPLHVFSAEQFELFNHRYDNGYNLYNNQDYVAWLQQYHPDSLPDDLKAKAQEKLLQTKVLDNPYSCFDSPGWSRLIDESEEDAPVETAMDEMATNDTTRNETAMDNIPINDTAMIETAVDKAGMDNTAVNKSSSGVDLLTDVIGDSAVIEVSNSGEAKGKSPASSSSQLKASLKQEKSILLLYHFWLFHLNCKKRRGK